MMSGGAVEAFEDMEDIGVLKVLLPEIQNMKGCAQPYEYHQEGDVWDHTMLALKSLPETTQLPVRWAVLLHDVGKPDTFELEERIRFDGHVQRGKEIAHDILNRLRFPKRTVEEVKWLVEHHMMMMPLVEMPIGRKRHWFLHPYFLNLMAVFKADALGTIPSDLSLHDKILELYRETLEAMPKEPEPLLTGHEIMETLGLEPGEKVGEVLMQLREKQLAEELTTHEEAVEWLESLK